jgi:hypothetical protein
MRAFALTIVAASTSALFQARIADAAQIHNYCCISLIWEVNTMRIFYYLSKWENGIRHHCYDCRYDGRNIFAYRIEFITSYVDQENDLDAF